MFRRVTVFFWVILFCSASFYCSPKIYQYENLLDGVFAKPEYLVFHRDSIRFTIQGGLPIKYLTADTRVLFFPEYHYDGGVLNLGEFIPFDGRFAVPHSETKINRSIVFPYLPGMDNGELVLNAQLEKKGKSFPIAGKPLAKGLNTVPLLARMGQITPDEPIQEIGKYMLMDFSSINIQEERDFLIPFALGSYNLGAAPFPAKLQELLKKGEPGFRVKEVRIVGLHAPENRELAQTDLAEKRAAQLKSTLYNQSEFRTVPTQTDFRRKDWFDFRVLLGQYDKMGWEEKEPYYKILQSDLGFEEQFTQMRRLKTFNQVSRDIFPRLRAGRITVILENIRLSDPEIAVKVYDMLKEGRHLDDLTTEDLIYIGQEAKRLHEKEAIFNKLISLAPSELAYNNLGVVYMNQAQRELGLHQRNELVNKAVEMFRQSNKLRTTSIAMHNLGRALILRQDFFDAYVAISQASGLERSENDEFLRYNEGLRGALDIRNGDYKLATIRLNMAPEDEVNLFNKGLAYFLADNFYQASVAFEESVQANRDYGYGFYGLAMIAAVSRDRQVFYEYLRKAIEQSAFLRERAMQDILFEGFREEGEFLDLFK
ncbi:tetratricopeptide repeat protein [Cecembia lonarensis]|uniref:Tetratricopeptide repeat protein n=1 Tax=Cecembia lonarensis (strain CCUG 58316 / KCTC 22772 / LW9) TaxID=1225176 RepID=K1LE98_CECL9|nr:hypothetical protein [Cecembia lonarensis]EKB48678.1 hypothetical protein B879_02705 [Cecembia lonarensis LW9]